MQNTTVINPYVGLSTSTSPMRHCSRFLVMPFNSPAIFLKVCIFCFVPCHLTLALPVDHNEIVASMGLDILQWSYRSFSMCDLSTATFAFSSICPRAFGPYASEVLNFVKKNSDRSLLVSSNTVRREKI